jgi:hypothetical protein
VILYNLIPDDSPVNNWLFWYEDDAGYVRPRQLYADLVCGACGKLDEIAAFARGIGPEVSIRSRRDFIELSDGMIAATKKVKDVFEQNHISGLRFVELPGGSTWALWPDTFVSVDMALAGFQFVEPKCGVCGRYQEVCVGPLSQGLRIPDNPLVVFASEVWNEDTRGRVLWLFAQEPVAKLLKKARLSGMEIIVAQ